MEMVQNQVNKKEFNLENSLYLIKLYKFEKDLIK